MLSCLVISYLLSIIGYIIDLTLKTEPITEWSLYQGLGRFSLFLSFLSYYPSLAVLVKRLHDREKSPKWIFLTLLPILGAVWLLIELGFFKGTAGDNRYGSDPLDILPGPNEVSLPVE